MLTTSNVGNINVLRELLGSVFPEEMAQNLKWMSEKEIKEIINDMKGLHLQENRWVNWVKMKKPLKIREFCVLV